MKLFIAWSGERSHQFAVTFHSWIRKVLQAVDPFMSAAEIQAGSRWWDEIGKELKESNFGVLCVTRENTAAPWLLFEAGALSKLLDKARVAPVLIDGPGQINGPLGMFQNKKADEKGIFELVRSVNSELSPERRLGEKDVGEVFDLYWPKLKESIAQIPSLKALEKQEAEQTDRDILLTIQSTTKALSSQLAQLGADVRHSTFTFGGLSAGGLQNGGTGLSPTPPPAPLGRPLLDLPEETHRALSYALPVPTADARQYHALMDWWKTNRGFASREFKDEESDKERGDADPKEG